MSHILDIEIGTYSLFTDNRNKINVRENRRSNKKIERFQWKRIRNIFKLNLLRTSIYLFLKAVADKTIYRTDYENCRSGANFLDCSGTLFQQ
jgi:hypothetical protein